MTILPAITPASTIRDAITAIEQHGHGIALVLSPTGHLVGTVTDGDIRRAILACADIDAPVSTILSSKPPTAPAHPIVAPEGASREALLMLMAEWEVRQVPCLDADGRVVSLATIDELLPEQPLPVDAVVMAGGRGERLRPLTDDTPKPMLPVGGRPLLDHTMRRLWASGVRRVNVTTHYLAEQITQHFGDGTAFGLDIRYIAEDHPLGTAGALANIQNGRTLLVLNGDLLCSLDYRAMLDYHQEYRADITVAACQMETQVPYGVLECDGPYVQGVVEKPHALFLINAGIYLVAPWVLTYIQPGERLDMTELIGRLLADGTGRVVAFAVFEKWRDVGTMESYQRAQGEATE